MSESLKGRIARALLNESEAGGGGFDDMADAVLAVVNPALAEAEARGRRQGLEEAAKVCDQHYGAAFAARRLRSLVTARSSDVPEACLDVSRRKLTRITSAWEAKANLDDGDICFLIRMAEQRLATSTHSLATAQAETQKPESEPAGYEVCEPIQEDDGLTTLTATYTPNNGIRLHVEHEDEEDDAFTGAVEFDLNREQARQLGERLIRWAAHNHGSSQPAETQKPETGESR